MGKLYREEPISLKVVMNIHKAFRYDIGYVVEIIEEKIWLCELSGISSKLHY